MHRRLTAERGICECELDGSLELVSHFLIELERKLRPAVTAPLGAEPRLEQREPRSGFITFVLSPNTLNFELPQFRKAEFQYLRVQFLRFHIHDCSRKPLFSSSKKV